MIAIIEGCGSNFASIQFALERLGAKTILTSNADIIQSATHVILPGVGTALSAMKRLQQLGLINVICQLTQPVLGICVGMQILFASSEEDDTACLSIFPDRVIALPPLPKNVLPHMGWNRLERKSQNSELLQDIDDKSYVYFIHGYGAPVKPYTLACTNYNVTFSAIVQYQNFYGVQFHPERSGKIGERILRNFLRIGRPS